MVKQLVEGTLAEAEFVPPTPYFDSKDGYKRNHMLSPDADDQASSPKSDQDQENIQSNTTSAEPPAAVKAAPAATKGNKGGVKKGRLSMRVLHPKSKSTKIQYENAVNDVTSANVTNVTIPQTPSRVSDIMDRALKV